MTRDNPPLITNASSLVFLQQPITHNLVWFPGTSSKPHSQVLEIDPAQLETQSFKCSIRSHQFSHPQIKNLSTLLC